MRFKSTHNDIWNLQIIDPKLACEWHNTLNMKLTAADVTPNSHKRVWWKCQYGHEWQTTVKDRHQKRTGCPYCAGNKPTPERNLVSEASELVKEWHFEKNTIAPELVAPFSNKKFWWRCIKGHEWQSNVLNRRNGSGCPFCAGRYASSQHNLLVDNPKLASEWHSNKNGTTKPSDVTPSSSKRVWWHCPNGHEWIASINKRRHYPGCPFCLNRVSKKGTTWLDALGVPERERYIPIGRGTTVDGFDPNSNTVYEFLGDYWHSNPDRFDQDQTNPSNKQKFGVLYVKTIDKLDALVNAGYRVIYRWESENEDRIHTLENGKTMRKGLIKC
jgi:hypothetical protein